MAFLGFGSSNNDNAPSITPTAAPSTISSSSQIKDQLIAKVSEEIARTNATALVNALTENCFELCVKSPKGQLSGEETKCVDDCSAKFMRSWNVISKNYVSRINQS